MPRLYLQLIPVWTSHISSAHWLLAVTALDSTAPRGRRENGKMGKRQLPGAEKRGLELEMGMKMRKKTGMGVVGAALRPSWGRMAGVSITGQTPWKHPGLRP